MHIYIEFVYFFYICKVGHSFNQRQSTTPFIGFQSPFIVIDSTHDIDPWDVTLNIVATYAMPP